MISTESGETSDTAALYVLDTNALIWYLKTGERLSKEQHETRLVVSVVVLAAVVW